MTKTVKRPSLTQAMQLALWDRHGRVRCAVCDEFCYPRGQGILLRRFEWDHHLALVDGGEHEIDNIRPVCLACHKPKAIREHKSNAKAKRLAKSKAAHEAGEKKASRMKSRGFDKNLTKKFNGDVVSRTQERNHG